jgi:hypothetical protein
MTTVPRDVGHLVRYFSLDPSTNLPVGSRIALQTRAVSLHPGFSQGLPHLALYPV